MTLEFTTIQHAFRKHYSLTCNEYVLADMIYFLSTSPEAKIKGWCYMSRPTMAEELGLTKQSILNLIVALIEKGFVIKQDVTSYLRTTQKWNVVYFKGGKETIPPVKKVYHDGKESLPVDSQQSLPNNNKEYKDINTISFPPNGEKEPHANKGKGGKRKSPQVAPGPPLEFGSNFEQKQGQEAQSNGSGNDIPEGGDNPPEGFKKPKTLKQDVIDIYFVWFKANNNDTPPKYDGAQDKGLTAIITYLKTIVRAKMKPDDKADLEQKVKEAWSLVLDNWALLEPFYQKRTKLTEINSDLQNILKQLRDGRIKKAGNGNTVATSKGVDDAINERLRASGRN